MNPWLPQNVAKLKENMQKSLKKCSELSAFTPWRVTLLCPVHKCK